MNTKEFSEAMNEINSRYIEEAVNYKQKAKNPVWFKWGAMAACVCVMVIGGVILTQNSRQTVPNPELVQIPNPIITVETVDEMEKYLDFTVPVLDKEVDAYSVIVMDSYPTVGQVDYTDGSEFRVQYGSGDISGIYGGSLEASKEIDGITVEYYSYADAEQTITYAIWEKNGFTFSYSYTDDNKADENLDMNMDGDIATIIQQCK